ncbi:hypothetical protein FQS90_15375 [Enterococcus casseliflavus]|uniref:DUF7006 family protein n=1 Tax=Enterococcus sp. 8E11_MSG4843 TaxID=1834190 RepID=UPI000B3ED7EE|nr:hypothetical protein [Enterococcus sp. 8E11_MSG4843]MBO1097891.1 hypothetical protein [Enterococcus casseliflavus]MBO1146107.1 hypothetical protein [Enterococcus casseliflavus]OUZ30171.1 hypothetical protein A5885_003352 [Enterococcus sp. 8E11_MSG4843]
MEPISNNEKQPKRWITQKEYQRYFQELLNEKKEEMPALQEYFTEQCQQLDELIKEISPEHFWTTFPKILGIDAKLLLLTELVKFDDFSSEDIIRITENDYKYYFKELCGYHLGMETKPSMVFSVV